MGDILAAIDNRQTPHGTKAKRSARYERERQKSERYNKKHATERAAYHREYRKRNRKLLAEKAKARRKASNGAYARRQQELRYTCKECKTRLLRRTPDRLCGFCRSELAEQASLNNT